MGGGGSKSKGPQDGILESPYPLKSTHEQFQTAIQCFLEGARRNVRKRHNNWLTDTVSGETLTFSQVDPMSRAFAGALQSRGLTPGDHVLYLSSNVTTLFPLVLGVWRSGGILHSSYPQDNKEILLGRIKDLGIKWVICDDPSEVKKAAEDVPWPVNILIFEKHDQELPENVTLIMDLLAGEPLAHFIEHEGDMEDPILVLCTSGTSGFSKGAVYTNQTLLAFMEASMAIPSFTDAPSLFLLKPTHILGLLFPLRNLLTGSWALMMEELTKENLASAVENYKPRTAFGFPTYLKWIAEAEGIDTGSLKYLATGGIVIAESFKDLIKDKMPEVLGVVNGLGLTECGLLTTTLDLGADEYKVLEGVPPLSVGKLYPGVSLKVINPESGAILGEGETGELVFKSPTICNGYLNSPQESEDTFRDGWIHTGDLGYFDSKGWVYVVGRIKETFKYLNNHISPVEIEEILGRHSAVAEAVVFGVDDPEEGGQIPRGGVVLKPEAESVTPEDLITFVDGLVPAYKRLRGGVYILEELPKGVTGKVDRGKVEEIISGMIQSSSN